MRWLLTFLIVVPTCFAQVQGNRPSVIDAYVDRGVGNTPGQITWGENVTTGQRIVLCFNT